MVLSSDANGRVMHSGEQIQIGGNESYVSVCQLHFRAGIAKNDHLRLLFTDD